jgi:hypothetical protein
VESSWLVAALRSGVSFPTSKGVFAWLAIRVLTGCTTRRARLTTASRCSASCGRESEEPSSF